jgi:hypothetical protein
VAFLRGAADHEESRTMLHDLLTRSLFPVLSQALAGPDKYTARSTDKSTDASPNEGTDALLRVVLCGSQIVGLGMARYVVRVEPLASMPVERLVALYAPTLQRYLTGELPGGGP